MLDCKGLTESSRGRGGLMVNADQEVWVESRVGKGKTNNHNSNIHSPLPPLLLFFPVTHPFGTNNFFCSVIKIKDCGHNFH